MMQRFKKILECLVDIMRSKKYCGKIYCAKMTVHFFGGVSKKYFMLLAMWLTLVYFILYDLNAGSNSMTKLIFKCTYTDLARILRSKNVTRVVSGCMTGTVTLPDVSDYGEAADFSYASCVSRKASYNVAVGVAGGGELARYNCSHLITFSGSPTGRFGNTLFQVASVIGLAAHHGYTPVFKHNYSFFNHFEPINRINFTLENLDRASERVCCEYKASLHQLGHSKNWSISGYLQSWKYIEGAKERIRKTLTIKRKYKEKAEHFLDAIRLAGIQNVGVHVRRKDFLSERNTNLGYSVAPESYIRRAMQHFYRRFKSVQFIFVSDDIKWCEERFDQTNHYFSPFREAVVDMALLASCDHVIVTTGTFGWIGAWLAGGVVTYFAGFPKPDTWLDKQFHYTDTDSDYYPPHWIAMY